MVQRDITCMYNMSHVCITCVNLLRHAGPSSSRWEPSQPPPPCVQVCSRTFRPPGGAGPPSDRVTRRSECVSVCWLLLGTHSHTVSLSLPPTVPQSLLHPGPAAPALLLLLCSGGASPGTGSSWGSSHAPWICPQRSQFKPKETVWK